jgi:hypothetical protein
MMDKVQKFLVDHDCVSGKTHHHDESSSADNIASDMATEGRLYEYGEA